jgi:hypothetical protein
LEVKHFRVGPGRPPFNNRKEPNYAQNAEYGFTDRRACGADLATGRRSARR